MLRVENISWTAPDGKKVLQDVSFNVDEGKLIAITGPNGGGKTTLAKIIAGIETPDSGKIYLDDEELTALDVTERAKKGVSFAFQQPVRFKGITVRQLLEIAAAHPLTENDLCRMLSSVGLCARDYLNREIDDTLSGGEIKRIEIATVLARHTKLSIFDEPEAGIDLWSFKNLIGVFQDIRRNLKGTLIIISHQERILRIADEIILVSGGHVQERGPGQEMLARMLTNTHKSGTRDCYKEEGLFNG